MFSVSCAIVMKTDKYSALFGPPLNYIEIVQIFMTMDLVKNNW